MIYLRPALIMTRLDSSPFHFTCLNRSAKYYHYILLLTLLQFRLHLHQHPPLLLNLAPHALSASDDPGIS